MVWERDLKHAGAESGELELNRSGKDGIGERRCGVVAVGTGWDGSDRQGDLAAGRGLFGRADFQAGWCWPLVVLFYGKPTGGPYHGFYAFYFVLCFFQKNLYPR